MMMGPCAKMTVVAVIVNGVNVWVGTNVCLNPQEQCPRADMPSGVGYERCRQVCQQPYHAEVAALKLAGKGAEGGVMYLLGHTYACADCERAAMSAGIKNLVVVKEQP